MKQNDESYSQRAAGKPELYGPAIIPKNIDPKPKQTEFLLL